MKTFKTLGILLFSLIFIGACSDSNVPVNNKDGTKNTEDLTVEKSDFEHLFYHEHNKYSVLVKKDGKVYSVRFPPNHYVPVTIFVDVKEGESNWYELRYRHTKSIGYYDQENNYLHIHIKDTDSINGAAWNHGKFGTGLTSKVQ